jgi:hypothetical protein
MLGARTNSETPLFFSKNRSFRCKFMNPLDHVTHAEAASSHEGMRDNEPTGLPGLRTWRGVYLFVFGCFILWVVLLIALTVIFS